jgi:hypothetical protein
MPGESIYKQTQQLYYNMSENAQSYKRMDTWFWWKINYQMS